MLMLSSDLRNLDQIPIYITTRRYQRRTHHKYRINKKWAKRYGFEEYDLMPEGQVMMVNNTLYINQKDYDKLKEKIK